nr:5'/3'-nucleotidase SurE [Propionicimonas sp.]
MTHHTSGRPARRPILWLVALLTAVGMLFAVPAAASAHGSRPRGLQGVKILLTNDDSMQAARPNNTDGLGLYEVRKALCAQGADVVVIAPWAVQSGKGTAVTNSGSFRLGQKALPAGYESDCASASSHGPVFGVCTGTTDCSATSGSATPADTVMFALRGGLAATVGWDEPDLVVSGSNSGANVASSVNDSGTVGATIAAISDGLPAVAFSSSTAADFSMPVVNYTATATWGAAFLAALHNKGLLLQNNFALNVNYPDISTGIPAGSPTWVKIGSATYAYHGYTRQADGSWTIALSICADKPICVETRRDADWTTLTKKHRITVAPITWDRTYGVADGGRTLAKVRNFVGKYGRR